MESIQDGQWRAYKTTPGLSLQKEIEEKYLIDAVAGIPLKEGSEKDFRIARETDLASSLKDKLLFFFSSLSTYGRA